MKGRTPNFLLNTFDALFNTELTNKADVKETLIFNYLFLVTKATQNLVFCVSLTLTLCVADDDIQILPSTCLLIYIIESLVLRPTDMFQTNILCFYQGFQRCRT